MFARSLATAALLVLGLPVLPSTAFAEPTKDFSATVSAFDVPGSATLSTLTTNGQRFDALWSGTLTASNAMIPWPSVACIWVGRPVCWIYFVDL
jgi:hypothetical protein